MIQDIGDLELIAAFPPGGALGYVTSTFGIDLNPNAANAGTRANPNAGTVVIPGMGEELLFRIDIAQSFTIGAGVPVAQFHILLAEDGDGTAVHGGENTAIATLAPGVHLVQGGAEFAQGFIAADLVAGNSFFLRANPWSPPMGRQAGGGLAVPQTIYRWVGIAITSPNYLAVTDRFDGGVIRCHLVQSADVFQGPDAFVYPSSVQSVG